MSGFVQIRYAVSGSVFCVSGRNPVFLAVDRADLLRQGEEIDESFRVTLVVDIVFAESGESFIEEGIL